MLPPKVVNPNFIRIFPCRDGTKPAKKRLDNTQAQGGILGLSCAETGVGLHVFPQDGLCLERNLLVEPL